MSVLQRRDNWISATAFITAVIATALALPRFAAGQEATAPTAAAAPDRNSPVDQAAAHMQGLEMRLAGGNAEAIELVRTPILTFGDLARDNKNGTLWAFGSSGRPIALLELYQGIQKNPSWIHAVTLTGTARVTMKTPLAAAWKPATDQIAPVAIADAPAPDLKETRRFRQMKDLAQRFTAHEFWNPDNSRFELRLLVQPVHRYSEAAAEIQDGTVFVLAHDTNPEMILLVEALGKSIETARWHYGLARQGSAEMHVELDGKEVWKRERTPGVVGKSTDPYWLFESPVELPLPLEPQE